MSFSLQRFFARYNGFLRTVKGAYVLNNLLNAGVLARNRALYNRYGLKKSIFSPISSKDFKTHNADIPWIDRPEALSQLKNRPGYAALPVDVQEQVGLFIEQGFMVLKQFAPSQSIDALNQEIDGVLENGATGFNYTGRKIFNLFETSTLADQDFLRRPQLLQVLEFLLGKSILPFQTLNFTLGSEQRPHSDLIHMTTEPRGYMIAVWYALEDCTKWNGPVVYYPGSHKLPFVGTEDYPSGDSTFLVGNNSNARYEDKIAAVIAQNDLKAVPFLAKKGDILIWHSNLIHGGSPIKGVSGHKVTRKSMVCHYFTEEVICYHEMLHRPALIKHIPQ